MASKTPTWVWVVFGILGFCALIFIALVGGSIFMFRQHAGAFPPPWDRAIPVGIAGILLFAVWRLRRQVRLFREDR